MNPRFIIKMDPNQLLLILRCRTHGCQNIRTLDATFCNPCLATLFQWGPLPCDHSGNCLWKIHHSHQGRMPSPNGMCQAVGCRQFSRTFYCTPCDNYSAHYLSGGRPVLLPPPAPGLDDGDDEATCSSSLDDLDKGLAYIETALEDVAKHSAAQVMMDLGEPLLFS